MNGLQGYMEALRTARDTQSSEGVQAYRSQLSSLSVKD